MRALAALTICVSLGCGAACAAADECWKGLHDQGVAAMDRKDFEAASEFFRKSWDVAETTFEYGLSANDYGVALFQLDRYKDALPWLQRSLAIWKSDPARSRYALQTTEAVGAVLRQLGEYRAAEQLLLRALVPTPANNEDHALILNLLADILREEGKPSEARDVFSETLRLKDISWKSMVQSIIGLADLDRSAHSWDNSFAEWNGAAEMAREHNAPAIEAVALRGLGETWLDKGDLARAEPLLRRALAIFRSIPVSSGEVPTTLGFIGQLYLSEDKTALAEDVLTKALDEQEHVLGENHPQVAILLQMMGDAAARRSKMELARDYFDRALRIMEGRFGENSMMAAVVFANWATSEQRAGDFAEAVARFQKSLDILRMAGQQAASVRASVMERYAQVLKASHRGKEASALLAQVKGLRDVR